MNVIVHRPENEDHIQELMKRVAAVHAQAAIGYIQKLSCPREQKLLLIKEIVRSVRSRDNNTKYN